MEEKVSLGRFELSTIPFNNLTEWVNGWMAIKRQCYIHLLNKKDLWKVYFSHELRAELQKADLVFCTSPRKTTLPPKKKSMEVLSPFSIVIRLLSALESLEGSLYLLGGNDSQIQKVYSNLQQTFPHLYILGKLRGQPLPNTLDNVLTAISKAAPNMLLLGTRMGDGHEWIQKYRQALPSSLIMWSEYAFLKIAGGW